MFSSAEEVAVAASISMSLEVLASPKSGNVDRDHDFEDLKLSDFVVSSICALPPFMKLASGEIGVGECIYRAIDSGVKFYGKKNVHFGALLLLAPLVASKGDPKKAVKVVRSSDWRQSLYVYRAFKIASPRVISANDLDLKDEETEKRIETEKIGLFDWLSMAPPENVIAREVTNGYKYTVKCKEAVTKFADEFGFERAVVIAYHEILSEVLDPLIIAKHGKEVAKKVRKLAKDVLREFKELKDFSIFADLDERLLKEGINPGSVADITIGGIFLSMLEGVRIA